MLKNTLCAAVLGSLGLLPATAGSYAAAGATDMIITPLGMAIAAQGNAALRTIQREAEICLRSLKPAPLEAVVQPVKREVEPAQVAQELTL